MMHPNLYLETCQQDQCIVIKRKLKLKASFKREARLNKHLIDFFPFFLSLVSRIQALKIFNLVNGKKKGPKDIAPGFRNFKREI